MSKKTVICAVMIAGCVSTQSGLAADPVFYAGLNAGWNATEFDLEKSVEGGTPSTSQATFSGSGAAFGGVLGVKCPISTGYIGIEANVSDSGAESEEIDTLNGARTLGQKLTSDLGYGIAGILAFNLNAHSQFYGVAGYQMTDFQHKIATRDTGTGEVTNDSFDDSLGGVRLGAGIETALTSSLSARVEWTTTMYDSTDFDVNTAGGVVGAELEPTESRVTIGVIGHF